MAPQKRSAQEANSLLTDIEAVVMDIEGTTTPISFVKDQLFPYVKDKLDSYLEKNYDEPETQKDIAALRKLASKDKEEGTSGVVEIPDADASKEDIIKAVAENVRWQMSKDRKSTELKQLQGRMWQEGYKSGEFKDSLYPDVPKALKQLTGDGIKLYVYSSGSIEAQKLLFGHTTLGDLTPYFLGFFDTTTGSKKESSSYKKIQEEIGCDAPTILFLTDCPEEAKAAGEAGFQTTLVLREGNASLSPEQLTNFSCIESFDELNGEDDFDDDPKRFEGGNGEADDDDEDPDDDDEDDEVDEENPDDEDDS